MLARGNPDSERILVMDTNAIGTDVGPLTVGILHDHHAAGTDIAPAVVLMPTRGRKFK